MKRYSSIITAFLVAGVALAAAPAASAQDRHDRRGPAQTRSNGDHGRDRAQPRAVPRDSQRPVIVAPRTVRPTVVPPYYSRPSYSRPYYAQPYYARPYYSRPYVFRPHLNLGFGVVLGYPVPYAYAYPYPVPVYGYSAPSGPVVVGPTSTQYGGVSLEISPSDASVYVDGSYAGIVEDFDGTQNTLTLAYGRHRLEISAPGYEPMTIDVDVVPGQILPYQGSLQRY